MPDRDVEIPRGDAALMEEIPKVLEERRETGLDGLVGGLRAVIINVEPHLQVPAVEELLRYTGLDLAEAFREPDLVTYVLKAGGSADVLVRSRSGDNPFSAHNDYPKARWLPNTRLETLVFDCRDVERYFSVQSSLGTRFLSGVGYDPFPFVQTVPSFYTSNSLGFAQGRPESYAPEGAEVFDPELEKPELDHLNYVGALDHAATRVRAEERDAAILEFMRLTNYDFDFAVYVKALNSITSVARLSPRDFAMVFTSGISPYVDMKSSGPTERFIQNYGTRVHHLAFYTEKIEETFRALKDDGQEFLIELVGSPGEGLKQTFTMPSENTLLVREYIHRYEGFDGFFTRSNVTLLTAATDKQ